MWVIFHKDENKNPIPGTWGEVMAIMEWYYDAGSLKSVGAKRYVSIQACGYRKIRPGEALNLKAEFFCKLKNEPVSDETVMGIDCKNGNFQVARGLWASPA